MILNYRPIPLFLQSKRDEPDLHSELAENLHRLDLTKDQRDEHIRRYAELPASRPVIEGQNVYKSDGRPKEVARQIVDETGLSDDRVRRALNPKPRIAVIPNAARSEHDDLLSQVLG